MSIRTVRKVFIALVVTLISVPTLGQDLLARQAPVDKRMKAMDSICLHRYLPGYGLGSDFTGGTPSKNLYPEWNNKHGRNYGVALPAEYKVSLRNFCMPCDSRLVTSHYGYRAAFGRNHYGTDIKLYVGDTVRAAFSGKVRIVAYEPAGYGNYVIIRHDNGLETVYGHMSKHLVKENQVVRAGQPIGLGGNTGRSTGSHLHFETRLLGEYIDPELMFDFQAQDTKGDYYVFRSNGHSTVVGNAHHSVKQSTTAQKSTKKTDVASSKKPSKAEADEKAEETKKKTDIQKAADKKSTTKKEETKKEETTKSKDLAKADTKSKTSKADDKNAKKDSKDAKKADDKKAKNDKAEASKKDTDKKSKDLAQAKTSTKEESKSNTHSVKAGDTLYSIAKKYNTTVAEICKKNNITESTKLQPGQVIKCS